MAHIKSDAYGKTRVRLTYVDRTRQPHVVTELCIAILLEGDFASAYTGGDNSNVLPTDTIKNTAYVLARTLKWDSMETLARGLAEHFLRELPQVSQVNVEMEQIPWQPVSGHSTAFFQSGNERRIARLRANRSETTIHAGIKQLQILKTADSAFAAFLKSEFTTLRETHDRLFATVLEADWLYVNGDVPFNESHRQIRTILLDCFAQHKSLSVQHTLFAMGAAVIDKVDAVAEIHLVMPNKHCLLVDLSGFGLDNPNMVFVPTDEPSGYIEARIGR